MISNYAYIICIIFHKVTRICVKCMIKHELQHCRKGRSGEEVGFQENDLLLRELDGGYWLKFAKM